MKLTQLYYFRTLAQLQHYTNTAKELYITQPTLSEAMSSLEDELGVKLFKKNGRNIQLTKEGKEFYHYVIQSLNELERGINQISNSKSTITGTIKIGCIPTLLGDFLPSTTNNYLEKNPQVKINVYSGYTKDIVNQISLGVYDIGFCSKTENFNDLIFIPVQTQEIVAVVNINNTLSNTSKIELAKLKSQHLITYRDNSPIGNTVKTLLEDKKVKANYEFDDEISIGGMVSINENKIGIAADTSFLKQFDNIKTIKIIDVPQDLRYVYLVYNKKNFISSAVESFINHIALNEINL